MTMTTDAAHGEALVEAIDRACRSVRHDDGLILALAAAGERWWTISLKLGLSDEYVRSTIRQARR
jgi:hypothetical protein